MDKNNEQVYDHFISLNTQGLRDRNKSLRLIEYIKQQKAHFIYLQETHFSPDIENSLNLLFSDFHTYHAFGTSNSRGCSILIRKDINFKYLNHKLDSDGRYVILNIERNQNTFSLINIYAPNSKKERNVYFRQLNNTIRDK